MVIGEEVNKFGSGPGDSWNTVLLLMDGTLRTLSNFTVFQQSEVIDGKGNPVASEGTEAD